MFPYRFDPPTTPAPPPPPAPAPAPRGRAARLAALVALVALVATGSAGAGMVAAMAWLRPEPAPVAVVPPVSPAAMGSGTQNVAGLVYEQASPAVVEVAVGRRR